jgi:hypothetical protein
VTRYGTDNSTIRLECVRLVHRHDLEPQRVIDRADALATYIMGDRAGNTSQDVPGDTVRVRTRRSRKSAEVSPAPQESPSKNP